MEVAHQLGLSSPSSASVTPTAHSPRQPGDLTENALRVHKIIKHISNFFDGKILGSGGGQRDVDHGDDLAIAARAMCCAGERDHSVMMMIWMCFDIGDHEYDGNDNAGSSSSQNLTSILKLRRLA